MKTYKAWEIHNEEPESEWVPFEVAQKLYDMLKTARSAAENDYACGEDLLEAIDEALVHAEGGEDAIR